MWDFEACIADDEINILRRRLRYECELCCGDCHDWITGEVCTSCNGTGSSSIPRYTQAPSDSLMQMATDMAILARKNGETVALNGYPDVVISPDDTAETTLAKLKATVRQ